MLIFFIWELSIRVSSRHIYIDKIKDELHALIL
jgi:hypothetical protein